MKQRSLSTKRLCLRQTQSRQIPLLHLPQVEKILQAQYQHIRLLLCQRRQKASKRSTPDTVESAILTNLKRLREEKSLKDKEVETDEDELFGRHTSAFLHHFTNQQKAPARLRIEEVLMEIEFGSSIES
jgi:hypothetical protein